MRPGQPIHPLPRQLGIRSGHLHTQPRHPIPVVLTPEPSAFRRLGVPLGERDGVQPLAQRVHPAGEPCRRQHRPLQRLGVEGGVGVAVRGKCVESRRDTPRVRRGDLTLAEHAPHPRRPQPQQIRLMRQGRDRALRDRQPHRDVGDCGIHRDAQLPFRRLVVEHDTDLGMPAGVIEHVRDRRHLLCRRPCHLPRDELRATQDHRHWGPDQD
jgi:hypothetical protein